MTNLERDASALVRDIIDACAAVAGMDDITLACKVDQAPYKARIVALVSNTLRETVNEAIATLPAPHERQLGALLGNQERHAVFIRQPSPL